MRNTSICALAIVAILVSGCSTTMSTIKYGADANQPQALYVISGDVAKGIIYDAMDSVLFKYDVNRLGGPHVGFRAYRTNGLDASRIEIKAKRMEGTSSQGERVEGYAFHLAHSGTYLDGPSKSREAFNRVIEAAERQGTVQMAQDIRAVYGASKDVSDKENASIGHGTGFAVSEDGFIVTAYHVVDDAKKVQVRFADSDWIEAKVEKYSRSTDVAILKIERSSKTFLSFGDMDSLKQGDKVFTMGYPVLELLGDEAKYTEGSVSALSGLRNEGSLMQISVPVQPGNSGGPLVNEEGSVVGMITSTASVLRFLGETGVLPQNVNWAVKGDYIQALLRNPQVQTASGNAELEKVRNSICLIKVEGS